MRLLELLGLNLLLVPVACSASSGAPNPTAIGGADAVGSNGNPSIGSTTASG